LSSAANLTPRHTPAAADALRDGVLIVVSPTAREAGFKYPVALTAPRVGEVRHGLTPLAIPAVGWGNRVRCGGVRGRQGAVGRREAGRPSRGKILVRGPARR
jgi:hypothetical protein